MTTIIASFGTAITWLLLSIFITLKRPFHQPERWLAWWLGAQAIFWGTTLLAELSIAGDSLVLLFLAQLALFSSAPAQYLYTAASLTAKTSYRVPVAANVIVAALLLAPTCFGLDVEPLNGGIIVNAAPTWVFALPIACLLVGAAFPVGVLRLIAAYERRAKDHASSIASADPSWLRTWALAAITVHLLLLAAALTSTFGAASPEVTIWTGLALQVASVCFVAHRSLTRPGAFFMPQSPKRPDIASQDPVQIRADAVLLKRHLEAAKPHLSPELTAQELADGLGWAPERLTAALRHDGCTFFDAVNSKRVRELQEMLLNPANTRRSLLILAYEAGFGSKSALYTAFRRYAGCSPAVWRQRLKGEPSARTSPTQSA